MAGLFDWISDGAVTSPIFGGGTPMQPGPGSTMGQTDPMGNPTGGSMPLPTPAPAPTQPMQPPQMTGIDMPPLDPSMTDIAGGMQGAGPAPQPIDPSKTDIAGGMQGAGPAAPPVPLPQPRPSMGATGQPFPPNSAPGDSPTKVPGPPMPLGPGLGVGAPPPAPPAADAQSRIARALGITNSQGEQITSGLSQGLKAVGTNWNKPGLAAFAGTAGSAMEGAEKRGDTQKKQMSDALKAAIEAKKQGDDAGYKQNYLRYLAAKLQADTDKAANKDAAGANKNDSPTQLYLSAQRLVQPERAAANKMLEQMRKDGVDPAEIAKKQVELEAGINAKLNDHYSALKLNPQTAAQLAKQPGNAPDNPIDAGKLGITKDNIATKLQPGQYFTNPADNKIYQFKGSPKKDEGSKAPTAEKPTNPEPADPMNKAAISTGATSGGKSGASSDDDDE